MADTAIAITAGSGTNVDTRTEGTNGNHRQVVVLGDPATNAGVAPVDATNGLAVDVKALPASTNTIEVVGDAAENAAAAGNPVLTGGRYDASDRTLGDGDVGAVALTAKGIQKVQPCNSSGAAVDPITAASIFRSIDVDESEDEVSSSACTLFWMNVVNTTASPLYLKLYNAAAASVTVGTTTPVMTFVIPTLGDTNGVGFNIEFGPAGTAFSTGLCVACTTALADADTGAPGANACIVNLGYS